MAGQITMKGDGGFTLIEMIVTLAILAMLAGLAIPAARNDAKRRREVQLKYSLSEFRRAIDSYKADCERGLVGPLDRKLNDECYPPKLEVLVEGIHPPNSTKTIRYLRAIPIDPMSGKAEWGLRSVQDDPDTSSWGEQNVYDVHSLSDATALNGTKYREW
jgi:general secretion pathway protein G